MPLQVSIILLSPEARLPAYATAGDAGMDLCSVESALLNPGEYRAIGTGIALAIPRGFVGLVHPRSGLAAKNGVSVLNTPGTVDSGYRGEIKVILVNHSDTFFLIRPGDRIAQLIVQRCEQVELIVVDELPGSERGAGGFGSTGWN